MAVLSSCQKASISGTFTSVPSEKTIVAKTVEGNNMNTLDTIKVSKDGSFKYNAKVLKGQPEFIYLYYGQTKVASLLLSQGDKVKVECDTLGRWTVSGSKDCETLRENELKYSALVAKGVITTKEYIEYYRAMTKFVLSNTHSLTVVPVLFSQFADVPVFSQYSDAMIFSSVADSLETVYPQSKYVRLLRAEGDARLNQLKLNSLMQQAEQAPYIDLNFDGMDGKPVVLSENVGKATLLVFWNAAQASEKMYNLEVLKPLYDKYAAKGLKIYQVCIGTDKATWALVVREQKMPWVNVCDPYGRSLSVYGVTESPTVILLSGDEMTRMEEISRQALDSKISAALK